MDMITQLHHQWNFLKGSTMTSSTQPTLKKGQLWWITKHITIDGEPASQETTTPNTIAKFTLPFPAKVRQVVVREQLWPTVYDNTLLPSLASLVACLLCGYMINTRRIISKEMRDRSINERETFTSLVLKGNYVARQRFLPTDQLIDVMRHLDSFMY